MSLGWLVETSGMAQLALGVILGWPIFFHRKSQIIHRFIPNRERLLQSHLDDILMGVLQIILSAKIGNAGPFVACFMIFGSWTNAQIFLLLSVTDNTCANRIWFRFLTFASFTALSIVYVVLFASQWA